MEGTHAVIHIKTAYIDDDAVIAKGRYADGSTALLLSDAETGEQLAKATVCMVEYGEKPRDENHVFIKDYAENQGMVAALQDAGVIGKVLRSLDAGYAKLGVHECKLLDLDAVEELP